MCLGNIASPKLLKANRYFTHYLLQILLTTGDYAHIEY